MAATALGFVGLGNMGLPMALRLLDRGWSVTVHDRREDVVRAAAAAGASAAVDLRALASSSDVIGVMVWDDSQLLELALGPDGLVALCEPGRLIIVHSSVLPATVERVAAEAARRGVRVVDAPVSGGTAGRARTGELTIMAGGADDDVARAQPVLEALASRVFRVGPLGAGMVAKIANNTMAIGNLLFVLEALEFADRRGVDPSRMLAIAAVSSGRSYAAENLRGALELLEQKRAAGNPMLYEAFGKDLFLTVVAAREQLLHLPLTALAASLSADLVRRGEMAVGEAVLRPKPE